MDAPPPIKNNPPPPSTALDRVPFETARERVADAIEEMGLDWKSQYGEPLLEHPGANPRVAGELEEILAEFDLVLETIVERLRSLGS